jgi:hypothetical protein
LSTGQFDTALAHDSIVAVWEKFFVIDEGVGIGHLTGLIEHLVGNILQTIANIFSNGSRKEDWFLTHYRNLLVVPAGVEGLNIDSIEEYLA